MREYKTKCPECLKRIRLSLGDEDKRRNEDEFFTIVCEHCGHQWYAKIFETLSIYPHKLSLKEWKMKPKKKAPIEPKFFYYKDKKIPISQYQKAGYEKLLPLYLKIRTRWENG